MNFKPLLNALIGLMFFELFAALAIILPTVCFSLVAITSNILDSALSRVSRFEFKSNPGLSDSGAVSERLPLLLQSTDNSPVSNFAAG